MNYDVYLIYLAQKKRIARAEECPNEHSEEERSLLAEMKLGISILEECDPDYAVRHNMEQTMFATFTPEQRDFICAQIGWWYLMWKDKMWVEDKPNQHWLGRGKEDLKTMICGD